MTHDTKPQQVSERDLILARSLLAITPFFGRIAWRAAQECGVGSPERCKLLFVLKAGPMRVGLAAQHLKLSPAAVTELVEPLVAEGSVRREADPEDRRAVVVGLTADGRRLVERYEQVAAAGLAERLTGLSAPQRRRIEIAIADLRTAFMATDPVGARGLRALFTSTSRTNATLHRNTRKEAAHAR